MTTRRALVSGGLAGVALASTLSGTPGRGADVAPDNDFEGKFLVIQHKSEPDHGVYIESARVKKLGDRSFVVGVGIKFEHPLFKPLIGVVQWIPVEEIRWIGVYPTLDALIRGIPEAPKQV